MSSKILMSRQHNSYNDFPGIWDFVIQRTAALKVHDLKGRVLIITTLLKRAFWTFKKFLWENSGSILFRKLSLKILNCQEHACTVHYLKRDIKQSWILTSSLVISLSFSKGVLKAHRSSRVLVCSACQIELTLLYGHLQFNKLLGLWLISFELKPKNLYKTLGHSAVNLFKDGLWELEGIG